MTTTVPTLKNVVLAEEDKYRKEFLISYLTSRGLLNSAGEWFIRQGTR